MAMIERLTMRRDSILSDAELKNRVCYMFRLMWCKMHGRIHQSLGNRATQALPDLPSSASIES
jgi:hypothetical protein